MKKYINKTLFLNIYFILFTSIILYKFVNVIFHHSLKEYWAITEWLINYQGGFVRRGLRGEIIFYLNKQFDIDPYTLITIITTSAFIFLIFFFVKGFIRKGYPIFLLPFVFLLGGPILNNFWMRADIIILIFFTIVIYLAYKKPRFYLIWINLFAVLGSLIHEIFVFISFPILLLMLFTDLKKHYGNFISSAYSFLSLIPFFVSTLLVSYYKGTSETAFAIWNSLKSLEFPDSAAAEIEHNNMGAIAGIGLTVTRGISRFSGKFVRMFDFDLYAPIILLFIIICIYFILANIDKFNDKILGFAPHNRKNKTLVSKVLLFQFCSTLPLYIIGNDYSRWIFLWVCSSFILLIIVSQERLEAIYPQFIGNISNKINGGLTYLLGNSKGLVFILALIIGFPLYSWNLEGSIATSSWYLILSFFSSIIKNLFAFLGVQTL